MTVLRHLSANDSVVGGVEGSVGRLGSVVVTVYITNESILILETIIIDRLSPSYVVAPGVGVVSLDVTGDIKTFGVVPCNLQGGSGIDSLLGGCPPVVGLGGVVEINTNGGGGDSQVDVGVVRSLDSSEVRGDYGVSGGSLLVETSLESQNGNHFILGDSLDVTLEVGLDGQDAIFSLAVKDFGSNRRCTADIFEILGDEAEVEDVVDVSARGVEIVVGNQSGGHAYLFAYYGLVAGEVTVSIDSLNREGVELEGSCVHSLDTLIVEVGLEDEAAESAGLGEDNHALRTLDTIEEHVVCGLDSGDVVVGGSVGDGVLLLEDVFTLGSIPGIEVEVTFGVGLVVVAGVAGSTGSTGGAGSTGSTRFALLAYSLVVGADTVLTPVAISVDGPDGSVLTVLAVLDSIVFGLAVNLHGDDNAFAIGSRSDRLNHTTLRNLLRNVVNRRLVLCNFFIEAVDIVVVVLTGSERDRYRATHNGKKCDFQ